MKVKPVVGKFRRGDVEAPNKLAIGICTLGLLRIESVVPLMMNGMPLGQAQLFVMPVGYGIQDARNIAWNIAEADQYEYFMFWDDDMMPLGTGFMEMLLEAMEQNPQIDIIGGVYPSRTPLPSPIVIKEAGQGPWWGWEDGKIHRVFMTGTGFTIYRMESIKKLKVPEKTFEFPNGPWTIREYFWLTEGTDDYNLATAAQEAGLRWYVHGGVICDQIEPSGFRYQVANARQRIVEDEDENQDTKGDNNSGPARVQARKRRPAHV